MELIVNSKKHGEKTVYLDEQDYSLVKGKTFYVHHVGQMFYVRINPHKVSLHRLIMKPPKGLVVDHVNRNGLDNRRENLRVVTIQENLRNQKRPNNKTGTTGVSLQRSGKNMGYTAQIKINYQKIHLGFFNNLEDAVKARRDAEIKYYAYTI